MFQEAPREGDCHLSPPRKPAAPEGQRVALRNHQPPEQVSKLPTQGMAAQFN